MRPSKKYLLLAPAVALMLAACGNAEENNGPKPLSEYATTEEESESAQTASEPTEESHKVVETEEPEEEPVAEGYPQEATPPENIPNQWQTDKTMTEPDQHWKIHYGEITDFVTFKGTVNNISFEPADTGGEYALRAQIVYVNHENYDIPIEDVFQPFVDGYAFNDMKITNNLGEPIDQVIKADHTDTIILKATSSEYSIYDPDDARYGALKINSPFHPESYGMYHTDRE